MQDKIQKMPNLDNQNKREMDKENRRQIES